MTPNQSVIAIFDNHDAAQAAIRQLANGGIALTDLSVVGKGYHTEEKAVGFYNAGDRIRFWGTRGAFWGALWGLFLGGLFLAVPTVGPIVAVGFVATALVASLENAVVVGGLSALGAALYGLGIPKDSIIRYEAAVRANSFLVMARGEPRQIARAREILAATMATALHVHNHEDFAAPVIG